VGSRAYRQSEILLWSELIMSDKELDPQKQIAIFMYKGKEVGRIRAAAPNAVRFMDRMVETYGSGNIEYIEGTPDELRTMRMLEGVGLYK